MTQKKTDFPTLRVGVSSCLLGEEVRYDGNHKRNRFVVEQLGAHVEWVSVCPEVEMGLGTPREAIRLEGTLDNPRLMTRNTQIDHTDGMLTWSAKRLEELEQEDMSGYILKSKSPSCGLFRIKIMHPGGTNWDEDRGLFARELTNRWPLLPVEEEGRLYDPHIRENFINRMYIYKRWKTMLRDDPSPRALVHFHTCHKMLFLAHHEASYRKIGPIVAQAGSMPWDELVESYHQLMHTTLSHFPTRNTHTNVIQHLMGFLKTELTPDEKQEFLEVLQQYKDEEVPLVVPLTLLRHHIRHYDTPTWLQQQIYLSPYPKELMLQNVI